MFELNQKLLHAISLPKHHYSTALNINSAFKFIIPNELKEVKEAALGISDKSSSGLCSLNSMK